MNTENGPVRGDIITDNEYMDHRNRILNLRLGGDTKVLLFLSMHCVRCMELVPELRKVRLPHARLIVFSAGSPEDHVELGEFLGQTWTVVPLAPEHMEKDFLVRSHPFCIIVDRNRQVAGEGFVYNSTDVLTLAETAGENKFSTLFKIRSRRA